MRRSVAVLIGIVLIGGCMQASRSEKSDPSDSQATQSDAATEIVAIRVPGMT